MLLLFLLYIDTNERCFLCDDDECVSYELMIERENVITSFEDCRLLLDSKGVWTICLWYVFFLLNKRVWDYGWEVGDWSYILWMAHSLWDSWPLLWDNLSCWNRRLLGCTLSSSSWLLSSRRFEDSLFLLVLAVQFEASLAIGLFRINIEKIRLSLL